MRCSYSCTTTSITQQIHFRVKWFDLVDKKDSTNKKWTVIGIDNDEWAKLDSSSIKVITKNAIDIFRLLPFLSLSSQQITRQNVNWKKVITSFMNEWSFYGNIGNDWMKLNGNKCEVCGKMWQLKIDFNQVNAIPARYNVRTKHIFGSCFKLMGGHFIIRFALMRWIFPHAYTNLCCEHTHLLLFHFKPTLCQCQ